MSVADLTDVSSIYSDDSSIDTEVNIWTYRQNPHYLEVDVDISDLVTIRTNNLNKK